MTHPAPHSIMAKIFHWGFVAVLAYAIYKQVDNVGQLADTALLRFEMIFAAVFLALLATRFFFMKATRPTALPDDTPVLMKRAARAGHLATYAAVGMMALSGLMIGTVYSFGSTDGALLDAVIGLHEISVMATYIMVALHISAAIYHRIKGDGIWSAMVPVFKEK